jgi:hypothetical protein
VTLGQQLLTVGIEMVRQRTLPLDCLVSMYWVRM